MKRLLLLLSLSLCLPAAAQMSKEEEELLRAYGATDEYMEMQRQMDDYLARQEKREQQKKTQRTIMLVLSLAVAVVPVCVIGKRIIEHPEERTLKGVTLALLIALAGGVVLFAINYGWMYIRVEYGDAINFPMALLITIGIAAGAIFLMNKKDKKVEKDS